MRGEMGGKEVLGERIEGVEIEQVENMARARVRDRRTGGREELGI
jgi:hypothetical protein